ncbi:hypothetical protein EWB00_002292 [Schistosoma japonicum]|uniref:Uncharacterized protein n=1 Tax=Schistosoma japonicum TaxID=6182 RepID=A0A4Z2DCU1_SCHJA|nr:hypothetical protein EWB00_002292 [Schistosoma japonicum]
MRFAGCRKVTSGETLRYQFETENDKIAFRNGLAKHLVAQNQQIHHETAWNDFKAGADVGALSASNFNLKVMKDHWISGTSSKLIDTRKLIPASSENDEQRRQ